MRKLTLLVLGLLLTPLAAFAATTIPWQITNTSDSFIYPSLVNGAQKGLTVCSSVNTAPCQVGIGTSSPWGMFSIHHPAIGNANPIVAIASSTATATTTLFTILNSGFTGVGTAVPNALFEVSGNSADTSLTTFVPGRTVSVVNTNTTNNNIASFTLRTQDTNGTVNTGAKIGAVFTSHAANAISSDLAFLTRNAGTLAERARITGVGNVGIGTSTPTAAMHVASSSAFSSQLKLEDTSAGANSRVVGFNSTRGQANITSVNDAGTESTLATFATSTVPQLLVGTTTAIASSSIATFTMGNFSASTTITCGDTNSICQINWIRVDKSQYDCVFNVAGALVVSAGACKP